LHPQNCPYQSSTGFGIVFKLTPSASGYTESIIHTFQNSPDGAVPESGLFSDGTGALYGTTTNGGASSYGTVFKLGPTVSGVPTRARVSRLSRPGFGLIFRRP
jgi:uncharacterized repeat protein (TIGR03803 family)